MAADQLNKRPKVSNIIRNTSWELQKAKKKKSCHYDLNTRSSISLQWDDKKEHVVPKKEQISIARRELTPFLPLVSHCQNVLGDVFAAPPELFELDNLTGLLSYEVWQTHLSAQEREFLTQLLPEGAEPHEVVHELFAGNNLYFGNPFLKWGASVCSGDCHPDAVLRQEQCNKANKTAYYSELHKYHTKMIGSLQLWKERWASCVNSENDFMQKILRPRKDFHKSSCSNENGILYGPEDSQGATSDSCSWDADDKSCSSESPDLTMMNGETIMRVSRMDLENKCYDYSRRRKGERVDRVNVECGDGAKYMSYIKVSKEQHERVKSSMKHSNTSIQPRSLNNVLGNLDSFCVQPYEMFEEEERQKLREHWLHLAKKDLSAGFENWKRWRSAKWQLTKSLRKEMEDKWKSNDGLVLNLYNQDQENEESRILTLHGTCNATSHDGIVNAKKDEEREQLVGNLHHERQADEEKDDQLEENEGLSNADSTIFQSVADLNARNHEKSMQIEDTDESSQNQHLPQIVIQDGGENLCPMAMEANNDVFTEADAFPCNLGEFSNAPVGEQFPLPCAASGSEIWPAVSLPSMYYHHHHHPHQPTNGYGLRSFAQRRSDSDSVGADSFFYPYPAANQERNELLLHSLFKDPMSSPYLHEQKLSRLGGLASDALPLPLKRVGDVSMQENINMLKRVGDVSMQENINILKRVGDASMQENINILKRVGDVSMQENINMYAVADGGGRFAVQRQQQQHLLPLNHQDWSGNGNQNWFGDEEMVCDGWSAVPNQVAADESLFSILSQCNRSAADYVPPTLAAATDCVPGLINSYNGGGQPAGGCNSLGWINVPWNDNK